MGILPGLVRTGPKHRCKGLWHLHGALNTILKVAILGADVVSELAIKIIVQLHLPIRSSNPFALGFALASSPHDENHSLVVGILIESSLAVPLHSLARC